MQYLLMIYRNEAELVKMDATERQKMAAEYGVFTQSIIQSGHFKAGDGLQPTSTATTLAAPPRSRVCSGRCQVFGSYVRVCLNRRRQNFRSRQPLVAIEVRCRYRSGGVA